MPTRRWCHAAESPSSWSGAAFSAGADGVLALECSPDPCHFGVGGERIGEAVSVGAEVLVTACPKCQIHFTCAMNAPTGTSGLRVAVRDLTGVLADAVAQK